MKNNHSGDSAGKPREAWPCYLFTPDGTPWVTDRAERVSKAILAHHLVESRQRALLRRCLEWFEGSYILSAITPSSMVDLTRDLKAELGGG